MISGNLGQLSVSINRKKEYIFWRSGWICYFLLFLVFNFVNTDKPYREKANAYEKNFTGYAASYELISLLLSI